MRLGVDAAAGTSTVARTYEGAEIGEPYTLGTYRTQAGARRALVGLRVDRVVQLIDCPVTDEHGASYVVEGHVTSHAELKAIVADYLEQSRVRGVATIVVPTYVEGK